MKTHYIYIFLLALTAWMPVRAQVITFDEATVPQVGVWDAWADSPFTTGRLRGNCQVVDNPQRDGINPSARVLGIQRSLLGSNLYGARVDLPHEMQFMLSPDEQYVHVSMLKPVVGRSLLVVLGKHTEEGWAHQSQEVVQSTRLALNEARPGEWTDVVFPVKGVGGVRAYSLVVVPDCESPHRLSEPFAVYLDNIHLGDAVPQASEQAEGAQQGDGTVLVTNSQRNGEVLLADGRSFGAGYRHPQGKSLAVKGVGEEGFTCTGIIVRYGQGYSQSRHFTRDDFQPDGTLVIPATLLQGDVLIEGVMEEKK